MSVCMSECAIEISDLLVEINDRRVLDIPSLKINKGERVAVLGPNGAGKSSLLKVLGGCWPVYQGQVCVLGCELGARTMTAAHWRQWRAQVGQLMQGLHLVPRLTALENVALGALARPGAVSVWRSWLRCYPEPLVREAHRALLELGLGDRAHTRADQLSGGERQKVSLARLRLQRPNLVLADEPTSALDPTATQQACQALVTLTGGATLVTVVHDTALLPFLADRVLGLRDGRLTFDVPLNNVSPDLLHKLYENGEALS